MIELTEDEIKTFIEFDKFIFEFCKRHALSCKECPLGELNWDENLREHYGCSVENFSVRLNIKGLEND